jgi:O-antigen/teichoic acid export membrane protein
VNDWPRLFGVVRWADRVAWRLSAVMCLLIIAGAGATALLRPSALASALLLGAPMVPLMALARIRGGALQGLHYIVVGQIPANFLRPVMLSLLLFGASVVGLSIGAPAALGLYSLTAAAIFVVSQWLLADRLPKERPAAVEETGGRWIASSIPMALTDGMRILQTELSVLLLGLIANASEVGLLRIAMVCGTAIATPIPIVNQVALPVIARLYAQKDMVRLQKAVTRLAQTQFVGTLAVTLPIFVAAEPLIRLAFGESYVPAANAVKIVAAAQLVNAAFGPNAALLNMTHHERRVTRAMAFALAINIAGVIALGSLAGLNGAAVAVFLAFLWWNAATWFDARRLVGIETSILPPRGLTPGVPAKRS